jgi:hypothetical protein
MQTITVIAADSAGVVVAVSVVRVVTGAVIVVGPVVVPVVVVVVVRSEQLRCSAGKLASASSTLTVPKQVVRWVRSSGVARPTRPQAARAFGQLIALELADLLSAAVATPSCLYSAAVNMPLGAVAAVPLGTPAAAELITQVTVAAVSTASHAASLLARRITSSLGHRATE